MFCVICVVVVVVVMVAHQRLRYEHFSFLRLWCVHYYNCMVVSHSCCYFARSLRSFDCTEKKSVLPNQNDYIICRTEHTDLKIESVCAWVSVFISFILICLSSWSLSSLAACISNGVCCPYIRISATCVSFRLLHKRVHSSLSHRFDLSLYCCLLRFTL